MPAVMPTLFLTKRLNMKSLDLRGCSFMTSALGGMVESASEAKVSTMRLIQRIWVTVSGMSVSRKLPTIEMAKAVRLMVNWKARKR